MNTEAYLQRIGYQGSCEPTVETLRQLHRRHMYSVPFENLDIEDPAVVRKILCHLDTKAIHTDLLLHCRTPPAMGFCLKHSALLVLIGT